MNKLGIHRAPLSLFVGTRIFEQTGRMVGRVRELVVDPAVSTSFVSLLAISAVNSVHDKQILAVSMSSIVQLTEEGLQLHAGVAPERMDLPHNAIFLEKDLLDQQIIDVHGFKVVRVNDVEMSCECDAKGIHLRIAEVEVGMRGATRRLLKGLPHNLVEAASHRFQARVIPWEFVDLIDRDPSRRLRLKVEQNRLAHMHPSDIADILEELAPAERDAVFTSLDEETAAEALEEVDPKLQKALIESLDFERAAGIVEEMDPGAAADLLSELSEERSEAILGEMDPEERQEVEELLEFPGDWAAGRMTTDYVHVLESGTVLDAVEALRRFEGDIDTITEMYLTDASDHLKGTVPLATLLLADHALPLAPMSDHRNISAPLNASGKQVAELFDKYNLRSLPVLDEDGKLEGVIHAEHVIALLRAER